MNSLFGGGGSLFDFVFFLFGFGGLFGGSKVGIFVKLKVFGLFVFLGMFY